MNFVTTHPHTLSINGERGEESSNYKMTFRFSTNRERVGDEYKKFKGYFEMGFLIL